MSKITELRNENSALHDEVEQLRPSWRESEEKIEELNDRIAELEA